MAARPRASVCGWAFRTAKTTTLIAGLRLNGMVAPMVLDGLINGEWFETT